jgi:DNA-binding transcriptional LysR family regulator
LNKSNSLSLKEIGRILILIEKCNLSQAAQLLGINTTTLKRTVKSVEDKISAKLFVSSDNSIELTNEAQEFYEQHSLVFNDYDFKFKNLTKLINNKQNIIRIACQAEISIYFAKLILPITPKNYKVNFENFGSYEIQKSNPKAVSDLYEEFDIIISDLDLNSLNDFNWNLSYHKNMTSKFYCHKDLIKTKGQINLENISKFPVLSNKCENQSKITVSDKNNKLTSILINAPITSSSLISISSLIENNQGIGLIPSYLYQHICSENIINILDDYNVHDSAVNIYTKSQTNIEKRSILNNYIGKIKQSLEDLV